MIVDVLGGLRFIQNPLPMSGQEMAKVDTTGMEKRTSGCVTDDCEHLLIAKEPGELTFFTHPYPIYL